MHPQHEPAEHHERQPPAHAALLHLPPRLAAATLIAALHTSDATHDDADTTALAIALAELALPANNAAPRLPKRTTDDALDTLAPLHASLPPEPARRHDDALRDNPARHLKRPASAARLATLLPPDHPLHQPALDTLLATLREQPHSSPAHAAAIAAVASLAEHAARLPTHTPNHALAAAAVHAADTIDHHRDQRALHALLDLAVTPSPPVRERLADHTDPAHHTLLALRRAVRELHTRVFAERALRYLIHPALAAPVLARLATLADNPAALDQALADRHLLAHPLRQRALRRARTTTARCLATKHRTTTPGQPDAARPPHARLARVVTLATATNPRKPAPADTLDTLAAHITDADPAVRHAAARAIAGLRTAPNNDNALADFAFDHDRRVALAAAAPLTRARAPRRLAALAPTLEALARSPHPPVRDLANPAADAANPLRPLQDPHHPAHHNPLAAYPTLAALKLADPRALLRALREALTPQHPLAHHALRIAQRLGLADQLTERIAELADTAHPRLAASAALALQHAPPTQQHADHTLRHLLLTHTSTRVRANALEALAHRNPTAHHAFTDDNNPRIRANAVRAALIEHKPTRTTHTTPNHAPVLALDAMLNDHRQAHRRSAIWAAERAANPDTLPALRRRAAAEPEPALRRRSRRAATRLEQLTRTTAPSTPTP